MGGLVAYDRRRVGARTERSVEVDPAEVGLLLASIAQSVAVHVQLQWVIRAYVSCGLGKYVHTEMRLSLCTRN